ncbi:MAG: phosphate acyltransferase PlsX [Legionellales bacterium]|nr:phosphate acyltransferase PlsX [Legionellales bacterium]
MTPFTIAIDAMGGDYGTRVVVPAALEVLKLDPTVKLILVGDSYILNKQLIKHRVKQTERLQIKHASEKVGMAESPLLALRNKKDSSMRVALNLVKEGIAQACVSAGNTGALLATARFVLKTIPGIDRPGIMRMLPTLDPNRCVRILDLGANVDSEPEHLANFAVMGSVVAQAVDNLAAPKVALLNIGEEDIKGNELVKATNQLLKNNSAINYVGYVEGDKMYSAGVDVIVCDGFVGNVALKVIEGTAKTVGHFLHEAFHRGIYAKLAGIMALSVLRKIKKRMDPDRYNGASLVGLRGIVIKSHGSAKSHSFANAILVAIAEAEKNIPLLIEDRVASILQPNV